MSRFAQLALAPFALALACTALTGCSTGSAGTGPGNGTIGAGQTACINGNTQLDCKAVITVSEQSQGAIVANNGVAEVNVGAIKTDEFADLVYVVGNNAPSVAAADLVVESMEFAYDVASPKEDKDQGLVAFQCLGSDGTTSCSAMTGKWDKVVPGGLDNAAQHRTSALPFRIRYTRFDSKDRSAKLTMHVKAGNTQSTFVINFTTKQGKARADIKPAKLEWPYVAAGQTKSLTFTIANVGDATLEVTKFDFLAGDVFSAVIGSDPTVHKGGPAIELAPPLSIEPNGSVKVTVTFSPKDDKPKPGTITMHSNDASAESIPVQLLANSAVPCLLLEPSLTLNFSGVLAGDTVTKDVMVKNCGTTDLEVYAIEFAEGTTSDEFSYDWTKSITEGKKLDSRNANLDPVQGPTKAKPLFVPKNQSVPVSVRYTPKDVTPDDPVTKAPKPDFAVVKVTSNAFATKSVNVEGIGVLQTCPLAKVSVKEGEEVVPQTTLHLKGDASTAPGGASIKKYKWTVKQPPGSNKPLLPNASFPNPYLQADAAGEYEFCLDVWDASDVKSCTPGCVKVLVVPNNAIHVELLWDTPGDPDQTDTGPMAGADLDLHFTHTLASGFDIDCDGKGDPWFSNPFDCFWFNPNPGWGSSDASANDDPSLDLDDTDGAGPENLNLASPEGTVNDPSEYSIGVHYWNDHGFGPSFGTVTVFLQGVVALKIDKIKMDPLDMWYVGKINWPNVLTSGLKEPITVCYQSGDACLGLTDPTNPKAGKMWKPTGDWCITKCYVNEAFNASAGGSTQTASCKKK